MLSDLFVDGTHFEWVLETLLELHHNHAAEDDLLIQYLLPTLCKALAFLKTVSTDLKPRPVTEKLKTLRRCLAHHCSVKTHHHVELWRYKSWPCNIARGQYFTNKLDVATSCNSFTVFRKQWSGFYQSTRCRTFIIFVGLKTVVTNYSVNCFPIITTTIRPHRLHL